MNGEKTGCARLRTKRAIAVQVVYVEPSEDERVAAKHAWALLLGETEESSFGDGPVLAEKKPA